MKYKPTDNIKPTVREDYSKKIIFDITDLPDGGHMLQEVTIPPKTKQRSHYHEIQTEIFYILEGEAELIINDQRFIAKPSDAFVCSPGDKHNIWNKSDKAFKLLVFKVNRPEDSEDSIWE
ncbi:MAG: Carbohydrate-binding protein [candidate division WS6 bacterium GW2011_GWA2_37_6]|uniref:Carbohydrate-binding protein n=1 Tax=candidate division WS6 bacterium GW2011_GWA2_37_6 TaxID=1619087 RepID=A0A0G0H9C7_9BACT|nr:MAG: Carbohydrate-binding protein [candidate division WS6 bacterium GW2011_GWA2_37_6]